MSNPWLKKNPFMSIWLSAAHRTASTMRGQATAMVQQQVKAALEETMASTAAKPARKRRPKH